MSDNSNLANSNNEPSMEDILSSIRKVIAEDLVNEEVANETTAEATGDDTQGAEDFPTVDETTASREPNTLDLAVETTPDTDLPDINPLDTDLDDILELDSVVLDLPDPLALTDEMGEELELVTLEDDLMVDLDNNLVTNPEMALEAGQKGEMESIFSGDEENANTAEEMTEMDIVMAANASILAQAEASDIFVSNQLAEVDGLASTDDDVDFDETLDLVMDSDASDYVTTKPASGEMEIENWRERAAEKSVSGSSDSGKSEIDVLGLSTQADTELHAAVDKAVQETLAETLSEEIIATEPDQRAVFQQDLLEQDVISDEHSDMNNTGLDGTGIDDTSLDGTDLEPVAVTQDEDMDLVKSLLDDLMDDPEPETEEPVEAETMSEIDTMSLENDADIADFTNDILFANEPDHSIDDQDILIPEPPEPSGNSDIINLTAFEEALVDPERVEPLEQVEPDLPPSAHSTLAQIAADVGVTSATGVEHTLNPDDIVTLEDPDLVSKLALASGTAVGTAALAATAQGTTMSDEPEPEIPEPTPPQNNTQEEEPMATPMKTNTLSGSDTQVEAGSAFASLSSAVQNKALAEENGPPIGELVKEALKPMLQEWLDNNLKAMVQRAVTKEIKRISSGK